MLRNSTLASASHGTAGISCSCPFPGYMVADSPLPLLLPLHHLVVDPCMQGPQLESLLLSPAAVSLMIPGGGWSGILVASVKLLVWASPFSGSTFYHNIENLKQNRRVLQPGLKQISVRLNLANLNWALLFTSHLCRSLILSYYQKWRCQVVLYLI